MATIQVRDIPEELYEVLRRRARRAGQSMQAYMLDQLIRLAEQPTKQEAVDLIQDVLRHMQEDKATVSSIINDLAADRR